METSLRQNAIKMIGTLNGQPLLYALKSPDTELYDFGFGNLVDSVNRHGIRKEIAEVSLHILCRFKVIWQNHERGVDEYFEDTPSKLFHSEIKRLIGLTVRRTALSKKMTCGWTLEIAGWYLLPVRTGRNRGGCLPPMMKYLT